MLMQLSPAELKVYLVVIQAIQRDRNRGLLAISQIAKRANLSDRHARKAIESLCRRRWLLRVNRATGVELTRKEDWNGRTVTYANPIQWRQRDAANLGPTGEGFVSEDGDPASDDGGSNASRNGVTSPGDSPSCEDEGTSDPEPTGEGNLRPVGERYLRPVGQRHSEYSEYLECRDFKPAQPEVEPSASSAVVFERSDTHKRITGFASAKSAEDSPDVGLCAAATAKAQNRKADAPAEAAGVEAQNPSMKAKTQNPTADDEDLPDPAEQLREVLSDFHPADLEDWDGSGVPDWVCYATRNSAPDVSADVVCEFLRQKADAGWQPRKWTSIPALVRDAFAPKPGRAPVDPWTGVDVTNVKKRLSAFMDGEDAPPKLVFWIVDLATEHSLRASDIHRALDAAWNRQAAPGQKNAPRGWNWFYEVLRAAFIPGYAARLPEAPAAPHPAHHATAEEIARGTAALDSLVVSYICKCGAEIRQYTDRVEGTCTCGHAKPISRAGAAQMPAAGKRRAAGDRQ